MAKVTCGILRVSASVIMIVALTASASADVYVAHNIAFNANGKNPWGPGNALEVGDKFRLLDIPLNPPPPNIHVDIPPINANPVDIALQALSSALGVPLPDSLVSLKLGGTASGNAHLDFEYFASLGRLNVQYPASASLNVRTIPGGDYVRSNQPSSIGSTFEPGVTQRVIPRFDAIQIGGEGYSEPVYGGLDFTDYNTPEFTTHAPEAMAKLTLTADVRAGLYTEVSAFFGLSRWRKHFNFGGPVGGPIIEINPSGLYVAGEDTGLFSLTDPVDIPLGFGTARVTYPQLGLTGVPNAPNSPVLRGQNISEVFRVDADLEKLIPAIGAFLSGSLAGIRYDLLNVTGGPVVSIYQDQAFTPEPTVQLQFSELVYVGGRATDIAEFPLGTPINWEPMFSNSSEITIVPRYILNNTFRNETGIDISIEVDLDAIGFDAPFLPNYVGPLINPPPLNVSLGRVALLEREWPISLDIVIGDKITIPKLNVDQVFNVGDLRLLSTEVVDGTEGTGDVTYVLNFNREVVGGPPREYQATVAGVGSVFEQPFGEGVRRTFLFEANEDVVLTDLDLGETYNLGQNFCLNGCDLSPYLLNPSPAFIAEDPNNPGQFLPPLYVTYLPDIPDTSVDVPNHPILGGPDTSNVNNVVEEEFGTEVIDLRTGPETTILARTREFNPEGDGQFDSLSPFPMPPLLDNSGGAVFVGRSDLFFDAGGPRGFYFSDGVTSEKRVRDGDSVAGGGANINLGDVANYRTNNSSQVAFTTLSGNSVFRAGPDGLVEIARPQQAPPEGNGTIIQLYDPAGINDLGQVAFQAQVLTPAATLEDAIYVGDRSGLTKVARSGESVPGFTTPFHFFSGLSLNDSGQVAFFAATSTFEEFGVFVGDGSTLMPIVLRGNAAPNNAQFTSPNGGQLINKLGQVAFMSLVEVSPGSGQIESGIYLGDGTQTIQIARTGDVAPAQDGNFEAIYFGLQLNDANQVAFQGSVESDDTVYYALFRGEDGDLTEIARGGQAAPDGNGVFTESEGPFIYNSLNNEGHVAFAIDLHNTAGGTADNHGIFLFDGTNIVQVARKGDSLGGSIVTSIVFSELGQTGQSLNDNMQVVYRAALADGREIVARFEPSLYWRKPGSGDWATGSNWSLGIAPTNPYDVHIVAENALAVAGPALTTTVKSLRLGGDETASATLNLTSGVTLTATNGTTIRANGILSGAGTIAGDVSNLGGTVSPGSSPGVINVDGNYVQDALGMLMLEIGGPLAGTDYDVLDVSGDVLLGGIVALVFLDGYTPEMGTQFELLRFGGSFDATQATFYVAGAPAGLQYSAFTRDGVFGLEIAAVPEPASLVLLLSVATVWYLRRRREV